MARLGSPRDVDPEFFLSPIAVLETDGPKPENDIDE
jgi:hypothetical protein